MKYNSGTKPGMGDPYWYEWSVGLKYVIQMLNPDSGIEYVELQADVALGLDDVVVSYVDGMTGLMKNVDLIVSRAGASTLSEIIALGLPSILIPSPYVANNHQYRNAMDLVNSSAAIMIEEKDLKGDILVRKIDETESSGLMRLLIPVVLSSN